MLTKKLLAACLCFVDTLKLTENLCLLLSAGHMVTLSAHHTVWLTPQTASTSLEEEAGKCSWILCVLFAWHITGIFFMQKNHYNATKARDSEGRGSQCFYDGRKNNTHVRNSSVLLLRCHVAPRSYTQSVEVKTFTHIQEMHRTTALRLNKQDLRPTSHLLTMPDWTGNQPLDASVVWQPCRDFLIGASGRCCRGAVAGPESINFDPVTVETERQ